MEDDRKRRENDMTGIGRTPDRVEDPMTQGSLGRPPVTPDPVTPGPARPDPARPEVARPGLDPATGPAGLAGAGPDTEPMTPEDRRHLEAQRAALAGRGSRRGGGWTSRPNVLWIGAAVLLVVLLIAAA